LESGSRMEYYSFGAWPAISLLLGLGIANAEETDPSWLKPIHRILAGLAILFAAVAAYFLWTSLHVAAASDVSSHMALQSPEKYLTSMAHLFDLTPQSVADLRLPLIVSSGTMLVAFVAAWILRERKISWLPNFALALGMVGFFIAAQMAYGILNPTLSSRSLAYELTRYLQPGDQIALYGDIRVAPGIAFYSHREVLLYDANESNLRFGSQYPDAPKRFFDDSDFSKLWKGSGRVFLVVPAEHTDDVRERLSGSSIWQFAETGGKTIYMNQPLVSGQLSLASAEARRLTLAAFH
jgi:hypothetical protein